MHSFPWRTLHAILLLISKMTDTKADAPVFRADIVDVPGLHSGLNGVVYLYGVETNVNDFDDNHSGPTAYTGYISGLECTGDQGCSIMVSPYSHCLHAMSRAPEYYSLMWQDEQFGSNAVDAAEFSGMVESETSTFSELEGKTVLSKYPVGAASCGEYE